MYVPCWEIDFSKVDIESSAPDRDPLDSFEGFAGGQSEDEVLGAVIRPKDVGGPLNVHRSVHNHNFLFFYQKLKQQSVKSAVFSSLYERTGSFFVHFHSISGRRNLKPLLTLSS